MKVFPLLLLTTALFATAGCKPKARELSEPHRKEAANLVSEAQFAVTLRDFARAEPLFSQATKLCPDTGDYWINLGVTRRRLGNKSGAKTAYEGALNAYKEAQDVNPKVSEPHLQQVYVLALLGRVDDARKLLLKVQQKFPDDRIVRSFVENKQLDRIVGDAGFKEISL
jgi:tetratricopeptide (TPR) repeat protein